MTEQLTGMLRCPVTRSKLSLKTIRQTTKQLDGSATTVIEEGILYSDTDWLYPVIDGVPRLNVEAFIDYEAFLSLHAGDYQQRRANILQQHAGLLKYVLRKNKRTKQSFEKEWKLYDHDTDKTWNAGNEEMLERFLTETAETMGSLKGKIIFDAGCGNGKLNLLLASHGIVNIAMDFSNGILEAATRNTFSAVHFIQGDVQFPPLAFGGFDIVHSSGVLIHTNNTELSFSCIEPMVKPGGKLSVWLYHHRRNWLHNLFNLIRSVTSKLPLTLQYYLYCITIFPLSFCVKKLKGNQQNAREMMVEILDWFTPEFRWEHGHSEAKSWFYKRNYRNVTITTENIFGFNTIGEKAGRDILS